MFLYTLGTALIGHRYWILTGVDQVASMDGFYKNLSIIDGFRGPCWRVHASFSSTYASMKVATAAPSVGIATPSCIS